jgi:hypothetical protein
MTLEQECLAVLASQMGPAAKVFLDRTCRQYLKKEVSKIEKNDLPVLAKCCFIRIQSTLGIVAAESIKKGIIELK